MSEINRFTIALDSDLKKAMQNSANRNDRNLNGEISAAIKFYLKYAVTEVKYVENASDASLSSSTFNVIEERVGDKDNNGSSTDSSNNAGANPSSANEGEEPTKTAYISKQQSRRI